MAQPISPKTTDLEVESDVGEADAALEAVAGVPSLIAVEDATVDTPPSPRLTIVSAVADEPSSADIETLPSPVSLSVALLLLVGGGGVGSREGGGGDGGGGGGGGEGGGGSGDGSIAAREPSPVPFPSLRSGGDGSFGSSAFCASSTRTSPSSPSP